MNNIPWKIRNITARIRGRYPTYKAIPHLVFNEKAIRLNTLDRKIITEIEQHPDGVTIDFLTATIHPQTTAKAIKTSLSLLRKAMRETFGQDLLIGNAGWHAKLGPKDAPKERTTLTYRRPHELNKK